MSTERLSDEQKCGLCADHLPCPYHGTLAEAVAPATPSEFVPSPVEGPHDHKGYSEEKCVRCGWVMGGRALNCMNNDTPHVFPSQLPVAPVGDEPNPYRFTEGRLRSLAVEIVDYVHGYTCEFSSQPTVHELEYDVVEDLIARALREVTVDEG